MWRRDLTRIAWVRPRPHDGGRYRPRKTGRRFSLKARSPSW